DFSNVLEGVTAAISQRLWHRREEINELVTQMGGAFVWSYDNTCTHYIHQGNVLQESFREFKRVQKDGKWIVSPYWLNLCKEKGQRLSELDFPHTFDPNKKSNPVEEEPFEQVELFNPKKRPLITFSLKGNL